MKILHVNTISTGGAAIAAIRLHKFLLEKGIDSNILFLYRNKKLKEIPNAYYLEDEFKFQFYFKILVKLNIICNRFFTFYYPKVYFNGLNSVFDISKHQKFKEADIIHLHWVVKFLDWEKVFIKYRHKKYVWTMHDMNPFTGGEHYQTGYQNNFKMLSLLNQKKKSKILEKINIKFVSPSLWLKDEALKSLVLKKFNIEVIKNPIPTVFNKNSKLNIQNSKIKLLFVAENPSDERKGFQKLINVLNNINEAQNYELIILGNEINNFKINVNHRYLGYVNDDEKLAEIYKTADYFIIPSIEDNLPNTVSESILCGTPVIGFNIGGIPDIVINRENGYLAHNENELLEILNEIQYSRKFLDFEPKKYLNSEVEVQKYIELYNSL